MTTTTKKKKNSKRSNNDINNKTKRSETGKNVQGDIQRKKDSNKVKKARQFCYHKDSGSCWCRPSDKKKGRGEGGMRRGWG